MSAGPADHHIEKDVPEIEPPHPTRPPWVWEADSNSSRSALELSRIDRALAAADVPAVTRFGARSRPVEHPCGVSPGWDRAGGWTCGGAWAMPAVMVP
jgi:hypothetical protein